MAYGRFGGGTGVSGDPYLIEDAADLDAIRKNTSAYYKLIKNIDLGIPPYNQGYGWVPIPGFYGNLNGNYKKIFNLYINRPNEDYVGFITGANLSTRIYDLAIENAYVIGSTFVSFVCSYFHVDYRSDYNNPLFTRISCSGYLCGNAHVGGIVGYSINTTYSPNNGKIPIVCYRLVFNCIVKGIIENYSRTDGEYFGGIIGTTNTNNFRGDASGRTSCCYCIALVEMHNPNVINFGSSIMGGLYQINETNIYDKTLLPTPYRKNETGLTTEELKNADSKMDFLKTVTDNGKKVWRIEEGRLPELYFMRKDCIFVRVNGNYLIWDTANKQWVKQFDTLPSTSEIYNMGMSSLDDISTYAWNHLKQYGKIDIINFSEKLQSSTVNNSVEKLIKLANQAEKEKICFSSKINFSDYGNDLISISG